MNDQQSISAGAYLSRIIVPQRLIKGRHGAHRLFWRVFPGNPEDTAQPFLFREEPFAPVSSGEVAYIVQSRKQPAWSDVLGLRVVSCDWVETQFAQGDCFYFRLLASPVRRLMAPDEIRAKGYQEIRRPSPREWTQNWFARRAQQAGFEARELIFDLSRIRVRTNKQLFNLSSVQFDGLLKVNNPEQFAMAWQAGIGPKKAFGFGLLSLKRSN